MAAVDQLLDKLDGVRQKPNGGWTARCPAHEDKVSSLSIDVAEKVLLHCFTGCKADDILAAVGMKFSDFHEEEHRTIPFQQPTGKQAPSIIYQHRDMTGKVVAEHGRFELPDGKKAFKWRRRGDSAWSGLELAGLKLADMMLWGAERLTDANMHETVFFCEGEKATQACIEVGLLAVAHGGGSSTKDFGKALEALRGRKVALWPDNDAAGREYMAVLDARLRGVAASLSTINVPLPPKGDAYEYFQDGGSITALLSGAIPLTDPVVDFLAEDGVRVTIPSPLGLFIFSFNEIEKSQRTLDAVLSIEMGSTGFRSEPYTERINILSSSAREALRRQLDLVYGKDLGWTKLLNTAFNKAEQSYLSIERSKDLVDIPDGTGQLFFLEPFIPDRAMTIMFGDGSSLKSFLSFEMAYCVANGLPFMGFTAPKVPVLVVDYEDEEINFKRRMRRIAAGHGQDNFEAGQIRYFAANGIPLRDLVDAIKREVTKYGCGFMIVDSIGPACGGRPEDADVGLAYARTIKRIGLTSLHLAHITKEDVRRGDTTHPFGSIFWHNEARRTWFIKREQEEESDDIDVGLFCRKANDGYRPKPLAAHVHFDGLYGAVTMEVVDIDDTPSLQKRATHLKVKDFLLDHPGNRANADVISEAINEKRDTVEHAMERYSTMFQKTGTEMGLRGRYVTIWSISVPEQGQK